MCFVSQAVAEDAEVVEETAPARGSSLCLSAPSLS